MSEIPDKILTLIDRIICPKLPYRSLPKNYDEAKNINSTMCAECGGKCCKRCGCHFSPDDFEEISFEFLKTEMEKGYISIDCVWGEMILEDFNVYILRVRNQDAPIVDGTYKRTQCILLTESGCKLSYEQRPAGGKLLIPSKKGDRLTCHSAYTIEDCCYEWKPHQKVIHQLIDYFEGKEIPCSI